MDREIYTGDRNPQLPVICMECEQPTEADIRQVPGDPTDYYVSACCGADMCERMTCSTCGQEIGAYYPAESEEGEPLCVECECSVSPPIPDEMF